MSLPIPPRISSIPLPPLRTSLPALPIRISAPAPPFNLLAPLFPLMVFAELLPTPLISSEPVRVRFSIWFGSDRFIEERIISIILLTFNVIASS